MHQRQFQLRTLLIAVTVLCGHFALGAWELEWLLAMLPLSLFVGGTILAWYAFGATLPKSFLFGVAVATVGASLVFGGVTVGFDVLAPAHHRPTSFHFLVDAVLGGIYGFGCSLAFAFIGLLHYVSHYYVKFRPDLYYVEKTTRDQGSSGCDSS
jgi:hypothetical protein